MSAVTTRAAARPAADAVHGIGTGAKRSHGSGGFRIEILHPGDALGLEDSGIGTIGRIDDARVRPGTLVAMHPHRDDEILTYLRAGRVEHRDTVGDVERITPARLMLMNAGAEFQHEELVDPGGEPLRALQIFLRPSQGGLEPRVQFHDFGEPVSHGAWRRVAGPDADAPLVVRSRSWIDDGRFEPGARSALPVAPEPSLTRLLYVFEGAVQVAGVRLETGQAALLAPDTSELEVDERADLVLFTTDERAPAFDGGMFSGDLHAGHGR